MVQFHANGQPADKSIDLYAWKQQPTGPITLVDFDPIDCPSLLPAD